MPFRRFLTSCVVVGTLWVAWSAGAAEPVSPAKPPRHEFTRMVAHWSDYGDPGYLSFIEDAKPDVAQLGFYGATFWGLAHTPQYKGYPAHFPVQGLAECGEWFAQKNRELHDRDVKVVGHMNVKFLIGDLDGPDGPRGFFKFYRDLWDEKVLGPKPAADITTMLEINKDGSLPTRGKYNIGKMAEYWACLNNPDWRSVLKAFVRYGVNQGVDGFIANYFYRNDCHCRHCVASFKQHLSERHTPAQLKEKFGIADLAAHKFDEIVCWHKPEESTPLRREMLQFSQVANKRAFDEVFIDYGRSLKPDLMAAQWNHLSYFSQISGDERCLLPADLWGRGEDYAWYSGGASGCYTDLKAHYLGEGTLQARYIRGSLDDKPFTLGKYEHTRLRVTISELAANGGAPMGFYTRFTEPEARETIVRYYNFIGQLDDVFRGNRSHAEVLLLYPRSRVHQGDVAAVDEFKRFGEKLLDEHVLFDVRPDDLPPPDEGDYAAVLDVTKCDLSELMSLLPERRTRVDAPWTVRVSASRPAQGNELTLHLVNYNRTEPEDVKRRTGRGAMDEKPLAAPASTVRLVVPAGMKPGNALAYSPEWSVPRELKTTPTAEGVEIQVPEYLVYCVIRLPAN